MYVPFPNNPCMVYLNIFTYIYHKNQPNVGKYTLHGWYGIGEWLLNDKHQTFPTLPTLPVSQLPPATPEEVVVPKATATRSPW